MAMPPGNVVAPEKMQFPAGAGGVAAGGNEIHQHHPQRHQWFPVDERDGFISWLRGEFAAANAIIDSLCHHLRAVGEPGEYDLVVGCIQQRRCNWNHVLHMQQYFSVGEVIVALQQVVLRRQQQQQQQNHHHHYQQSLYYDQGKVGGKDFKRSSSAGFNRGHRGGGGGEAVKGGVNSSVENHSFNGNSSENERSEKFEEVKSVGDGGNSDDKKDATAKPHTDNHLNSLGNSQGTFSGNSEAVVVDDRCNPKESGSHPSNSRNEKQNLAIAPNTFVAEEMMDGQMVNVVEGLKLYENLLDGLEVAKLVSLVNELRATGRRGQFQGQTYILSRRPMKGRGREMIQFGLPIADAPAEAENETGTAKDRRVESIPAMLQDVIDRLVGMQVMTMKPDSCIIDIYNEGDHSQPHMWPPWFGKPVSVLFLTECELTFGRVIETVHHGDYRGSLKISLAPGSLLVMQGKSSDVAKHAIPMIRKQRMLVTFTKSQPKKFTSTDGSRFPSHAVAPSSHWGPPPSRYPNDFRHHVPKHYAAIPTSTTGVLPVPPVRPQIPPQNGVQPIFMTAPVAAPMPFPAAVPIPPVSTGWPTASPRHPSARVPVPIPGTGVFLPPPGSCKASSPLQLSTAATEMNFLTETASLPEKENGPGKSICDTSASPKEKSAEKIQGQDCNGVVDERAVIKEEQQSINDTVADQSAGAV